ncbi:MAG: peptidase M23 [Flavobacteriales bacterium]|nr:peptidase M23 [Flavobacteriales bacterium]|tara:strand:+ start:8264 stop:9955 length:1692 start_codon:yes stop_codon:yes gene_type:complete
MKRLIFLLTILVSTNCSAQDYISPFDFPLYLSGTFGELRDHHFHTGIDVKTNAEEGKNLRAIADGYISRIKVSTWGYGKVLYIVHPYTGHTSVYAHMQKFNKEIEKVIKEQQYKKESFEINYYPKKNSLLVQQGDIIGLSGNSGGSGGPHLHFEIRDTKTEHPINPLAFGFEVLDDINPVLTEIKIYPHENSSINGDKTSIRIPLTKVKDGIYSINNQNLKVHGDISFSISTFDRQNGSPNNKNGVYSIKMFVDTKLIHHFEVDKLSFSEKKFINSHIDYEEYSDNKIRFNRCYSLPYNRLSNYKVNINKGILSFKDNYKHNIKFEVRDIENNTSYLEFDIQSTETTPKFEKEDSVEMIKYDEAQTFSMSDFKAHIPAYSIYNNYPFFSKLGNKKENTLSKEYHFMDKNIPLHKEIVISIGDSISDSLKDKCYIALKKSDGTFQYKGKTWKEGVLYAKTSEFGIFTVIADTINPIISDYYFKNKTNINNEGTISVKIMDHESGISYYRGEIDGKWILMDYDFKSDLLTYYIDTEKLKKGEHTLKIITRDRMDNETIFLKNFIY